MAYHRINMSSILWRNFILRRTRYVMYLCRNIVARSRNRSSSGNTTTHFARIVELHVTVNYITIMNVTKLKSYLFCATLHCQRRPVWFCHIFPHYSKNGKIFGKKIIEHKCICVLISYATFMLNRIYCPSEVLL
jgi:hypothetical protein